MGGSVFVALVRKDVYLMRGFMIATTVAGLASLVLMGFGRAGFAIGGILFLTSNVGGAIFIGMYSLLTERKEQSRLFALSLPISGPAHDRAKLASGYVMFGVPWLVLTAAGLLALWFSPEGTRGMVVYGVLLQGFVLALFSVVLTSLFAIRSEALAGVMILTVNICFSLFMVTINQPAVIGPLRTANVVWTSFARNVFVGEVLVIALSVAFALLLISRRRDYL